MSRDRKPLDKGKESRGSLKNKVSLLFESMLNCSAVVVLVAGTFVVFFIVIVLSKPYPALFFALAFFFFLFFGLAFVSVVGSFLKIGKGVLVGSKIGGVGSLF